jgi:hypothetical protein
VTPPRRINRSRTDPTYDLTDRRQRVRVYEQVLRHRYLQGPDERHGPRRCRRFSPPSGVLGVVAGRPRQHARRWPAAPPLIRRRSCQSLRSPTTALRAAARTSTAVDSLWRQLRRSPGPALHPSELPQQRCGCVCGCRHLMTTPSCSATIEVAPSPRNSGRFRSERRCGRTVMSHTPIRADKLLIRPTHGDRAGAGSKSGQVPFKAPDTADQYSGHAPPPAPAFNTTSRNRWITDSQTAQARDQGHACADPDAAGTPG